MEAVSNSASTLTHHSCARALWDMLLMKMEKTALVSWKEFYYSLYSYT